MALTLLKESFSSKRPLVITSVCLIVVVCLSCGVYLWKRRKTHVSPNLTDLANRLTL